MKAVFVLSVILVAEVASLPRARNILTSTSSKRVIDGAETTIEAYPSQVSLRYSDTHTCGAVILSETKVLTAAHCLEGRLTGGFDVYYGTSNRTGGGLLVNCFGGDQHPDYDASGPGFPNDIGYLDTLLTLDGITSAALNLPSAGADFTGASCDLTGWGRFGSSNILPTILRSASLPVIDNAACATAMEPVLGASIDPWHLCTFDTVDFSGACDGDDGGPLHCDEAGTTVVAGIQSWFVYDFSECDMNYPSVFTRVSVFLDYINGLP